MKIVYWGLMIVGALLEILGDVLFKKWTNGGDLKYMIFGFASYIVGSVMWMASLKYADLSRAIVVFSCLNVILAAICGVTMLGEESSKTLWIGVLLCVLGIVLVEI